LALTKTGGGADVKRSLTSIEVEQENGGDRMSRRQLWIIGLIVMGIVAAMTGCARQPGDSDEIAVQLQSIESTLISVRAQIAQNRAQVEALGRSMAAIGTTGETQEATGGVVSGDLAAMVAAMQEGLTDLSARVAEMEIFIAATAQRMRQRLEDVGPGS